MSAKPQVDRMAPPAPADGAIFVAAVGMDWLGSSIRGQPTPAVASLGGRVQTYREFARPDLP